MGHGLTFGVAIVLTLGWAVSGPIFHYSNAWQLIINTSTTVLTFLAVFLIQNTLNRDSAAIHVKPPDCVEIYNPTHTNFVPGGTPTGLIPTSHIQSGFDPQTAHAVVAAECQP